MKVRIQQTYHVCTECEGVAFIHLNRNAQTTGYGRKRWHCKSPNSKRTAWQQFRAKLNERGWCRCKYPDLTHREVFRTTIILDRPTWEDEQKAKKLYFTNLQKFFEYRYGGRQL